MRHGLKIKKLGRTSAHRKATLAAMSTALIEHKRIKTTAAKAKALRSFVEPILNRAKEDTTHNRREAFRRLRNKEAVKELFGDVAEKIGDRPGGYTRVVKLGSRAGDATEMAIIELVDYNDVQPDGSSSGSRKRTRRGGGRGRRRSKGGSQPKQAAPKQEAQADDLTKVHGVGKVFAGALADNGITTFKQLANADLGTLRGIIASDSDTSEASANEETWAEQAALLAKGDTDGHEAYVEQLKAGATPAEAAAEVEESADEASAEAPAPEGAANPEAASQEAEAVASDAANPDATGNPQIPQSGDHPDHGDAEQGAAPGTGEPPPESTQTNLGRSGHRG